MAILGVSASTDDEPKERPVSMPDLPRRALRRVVPLIVLAAAATVGAVAAATPAHAGMAACHLDYQLAGQPWANGFQASVTVTNVGSTPTTSWDVVLDLPSDIKLVSLWGANEYNAWQLSDGIAHEFANVSYNGALAPGQHASFGFLAADGGNLYPTSSVCSVD